MNLNQLITNLLKQPANIQECIFPYIDNLVGFTGIYHKLKFKYDAFDTILTPDLLLDINNHFENITFLGLNIDGTTNTKFYYLFQHIKISKILKLKLNIYNLKNIKKLKCCASLKYLDLSHSHIEDISTIQYCKNIEYLDISFTKIVDISILLKLKKLKTLIFADGYIKNKNILKLLNSYVTIIDKTIKHPPQANIMMSYIGLTAADRYLTNDPDITFFKQMYKKLTSFE
jgi:Leucine-rich repeat (LRR) protein